MGLNKSTGNMYPFITDTWNPIAGKCPHGCRYCSTNKFYYPVLVEKYSGRQRVEENELKTNLGKGNYIFVAAQNDLFTMDHTSIDRVLDHCRKYDNDYLFQTKNPAGINGLFFCFPKQSKFCITLETNRHYPKDMGFSPTPEARVRAVEAFKLRMDYVTIEPIMAFDLPEMVELIKRCNPKSVNVGADSGNNNLPEPSKEQVAKLIEELNKFTIVDKKRNLNRLL